MTSSPSLVQEPPTYLSGMRLAAAGFALALVNFVVVLDITIANVSVPHIAGGLAISPTQGTWAITSYSVAEAITVPLSGWLAARFGTVRWLLISLVGFGFFSLLCGVARTIEMLIIFRVLQGLSGGPLMPLTQTMLNRVFPPEKVPMAMGLWAVTTISAPIIGPILGGTISDNWSWPWIFFINVPVVIGAALVLSRLLPPFESVRIKQRIDVIGLVLLVLWVGSFQIVLDTGREYDWFASNFVTSTAIVALVAFVAFVIWEWYDEHPVVNLRLLKDRTLTLSIISISLGFGAFFGSVVLVPLWLQQVLGYSATQAGYTTAALGIFAVMIAPLAAYLLNRVDVRITISAGMCWLAAMTLLRLNWSTESDYWTLFLPMLLQGLGMPFFFIGLTALALSRVPSQHTASAAGLMTFMRTASGAIATALATTIWVSLSTTSRAGLVPELNNVDATMQSMEASGMSADQARAMIDRMVEVQASTVATLDIYIIVAALFLTAAAIVWLIPKPTGPITAGESH